MENNNIQNTGEQNYRQLQEENDKKFGMSIDPRVGVKGAMYQGPDRSPVFNLDTGGGEYWGRSTYDKESMGPREWDDPTSIPENRYNEQPGALQIANGLGKMLILEGTTFADTVVGTWAGIGNVIAKALNRQIEGEGLDYIDNAYNSFIDNPFSNFMQQINEASESWLPNYYSQAEINGPWYENFGANFWGDKFLKNIGFTLGAAAGAYVNGAALGKVMKLGKLRDAFKGTVTTATGKSLKESGEIAKAYFTGDAVMDGIKLTEDLAKSAKALKKATTTIQWASSMVSAFGEGRIEAITGANGWADLEMSKVNDKTNSDIENFKLDMMDEHPEWFTRDERGKMQVTDPVGKEFMRLGIDDILETRDQAYAKIKDDKTKMANVIFSLNVPLLTASNWWQFGSMLLGGYGIGRLGQNLVSGSFKEGFKPLESAGVKNLVKGLTSPLMEAQEEMTQQWIQEIPSAKYGSELNQFYRSKVDPDATEKAIDWGKAITEGFRNSYGDINQWEQGAIGFMTGLLGIPQLGFKVKTNGKKGLSVSWSGEFWESVREFREVREKSKLFAEAANKRNPALKSYLEGVTRHGVAESDMEEAIKQGKPFDYKNAETKQLVNDAILYSQMGRLQDYLDYLDQQTDVSDEQLEDIKKLVSQKDGTSIFENKSDSEIREILKHNAQKAKQKVQKYVGIAENLKTLYGDNISTDTLEEMSWMMTQIDDWESRGIEITKDLRKQFQKVTQQLKDQYDIDIDATLGNYEAFKEAFKGDKNLLKEINDIVNDVSLPAEEQKKRIVEVVQKIKEEKKTVKRREGYKKRAKERLKKTIDKHEREAVKAGTESNSKEATLAHLQNELQKIVNTTTDIAEREERISALRDAYIEQLDIASDNSQVEQLDKEIKEQLDKIDEQRSTPQGEQAGEQKSTYEQYQEAKSQREKQTKLDELKKQWVFLTNALTNENVIDPINQKEAQEKLIDLFKIIAAREHFIDTYTTLAEHPELFTEENMKLTQQLTQQFIDRQADEALSHPDEIQTIDQLREIEEALGSDVFESMKKKVEEGNDDRLKDLFENFKGLKSLMSKLLSVMMLDSMNGDPGTIMETGKILGQLFKAAKTLDKFIENLENAIKDANIPENVREFLKKVYEKAKEMGKSESTSKKDNRKPNNPTQQNDGQNQDGQKKKKKFMLDFSGQSDPTDSSSDSDTSSTEVEVGNVSDFLQTAKSDVLEGIVKGTIIPKDIEASELNDFKKICKEALDNRAAKKPSDSDDTAVDNAERSGTKNQTAGKSTMKSWSVAEYRFDELTGTDRKAVKYDDPRVAAFAALGMYDFVNNGHLASMLEANKDLPIHLVVSTDPNYLGKGESRVIFLAVDVSNTNFPGSFTNANGERFQVVGVLGAHRGNTASEGSFNEINKMLNAEFPSVESGKMALSQYSLSIAHMYSGRMAKSDESKTDSNEQVPLRTVVGNRMPILQVYVSKSVQKFSSDAAAEKAVPLNSNNSNPREGSVYMMVREADGRYYPKYVQVRTTKGYNFNNNTALAKKIKDLIKKMADPNLSEVQRVKAKYELMSYIYFGKNEPLITSSNIIKKIWNAVTGKQNESIITIGNHKNIGKGKSVEEKAEEILKVIQQENFSFNVSAAKISDASVSREYIKTLLDGDVLYTDLARYNNVNASFDVNPYMVPSDGPTAGHTGKKGKQSDTERREATFGTDRYERRKDGKWFKDGVEVTNNDTIATLNAIDDYNNKKVSYLEGTEMLEAVDNNGNKFGLVKKAGKGWERVDEKTYRENIEKHKKYMAENGPDLAAEEARKKEEKDNSNIPEMLVTPDSAEQERLDALWGKDDNDDSDTSANNDIGTNDANDSDDTLPENISNDSNDDSSNNGSNISPKNADIIKEIENYDPSDIMSVFNEMKEPTMNQIINQLSQEENRDMYESFEEKVKELGVEFTALGIAKYLAEHSKDLSTIDTIEKLSCALEISKCK